MVDTTSTRIDSDIRIRVSLHASNTGRRMQYLDMSVFKLLDTLAVHGALPGVHRAQELRPVVELVIGDQVTEIEPVSTPETDAG